MSKLSYGKIFWFFSNDYLILKADFKKPRTMSFLIDHCSLKSKYFLYVYLCIYKYAGIRNYYYISLLKVPLHVSTCIYF